MIVITLARKPILHRSATCTIMENGCGALNIEDCRIQTKPNERSLSRTPNDNHDNQRIYDGRWKHFGNMEEPTGRWPANLILSSIATPPIDKQSGISTSSGGRIGNAEGIYANQGRTGWGTGHTKGDPGFGDVGGASRYFKVF